MPSNHSGSTSPRSLTKNDRTAAFPPTSTNRFEFELFNTQGQRVMTLTTSLMMGRRERAAS